MKRRSKIGNPAEEELLRLLSEFEPMSHNDFGEITGRQKTAAIEVVRRVWDKKAIYIHHWERKESGCPLPFYAIGRLTDAERPSPKSASQKGKEHRAKVMILNPEILVARHKKSHETRKARKLIDPEYRKKVNQTQQEWARKKFGRQPRVMRDSTVLDEIAMQFGITWRFRQTRLMAA